MIMTLSAGMTRVSIERVPLSIVQLIKPNARVIRMARRSPTGDQRKRDPERTRERILEAALIEFSEHGFAGARTGAIAARAGVNAQLISYYFDGKEGLYRALQRRWETTEGAVRPDTPLADLVEGYLHFAAMQRAWARLLAWE